MTQEEKQLLLKDLCTRLPHGVICHTKKGDGYLCSINQTIFGTEYGINISAIKRDYFKDSEQDEVVIKPYLRPMSSMTEEEEREVRILWNEDFVGDNNWYHCYPKTTDFYLSHHFDFRNLIQKGLALEAPEGMYDRQI
jgi:hypothetical protein